MSNLQIPLDIESLEIISQNIDSKGNIIIEAKSKCRSTICRNCGENATKPFGFADVRTVQHTSIFEKPVYITIKSARYQCEHCIEKTVNTEQYTWCARNSNLTKAQEDYIMRSLINSTVSDVVAKTGVSYKTIMSAVSRRIGCEVDWKTFAELYSIGVDDVSMKKGFRDFMTIITARSKTGENRILAVIDGRKKDDVQQFFESIPEHLKKTVNQVCTDMYDGYVNAAIEVFGEQKVVIDRFHVSKNYRKPLDLLRVKELKRLKSELSAEEYAELKGVTWILRRNHECQTAKEKKQLAKLYEHSPILKEAYSLAIQLTQVFNGYHSRKNGLAKINRWIVKARASELTCFNIFIETLDQQKARIANYFKVRANSGFVEGLNNKLKVAKRRCYGILNSVSLFQRLALDIQGYGMMGLAF